MSKKSFTGVLNTMLGEVQEPDAPKKKKGSRPTTSTSKTEKATQEARESKPKEIRATFIKYQNKTVSCFTINFPDLRPNWYSFYLEGINKRIQEEGQIKPRPKDNQE